MTSTVDGPPDTLDPPTKPAGTAPHRRRLWVSLAVVAALLAVAIGSAGWLIYIHTYAPLGDAGGMGPATPRTVRTVGDGLVDTRWVLLGAAGTTGVVDYAVANQGARPIRLLGLEQPAPYAVTGMTWADLSHNPGYGATLGTLKDARTLPMTLQPQESVFLQVHVTKPRCHNLAMTQITDLPIRWEALGVHHMWDYQLDGSDTSLPIDFCPTKSLLAHLH
jgi:hypothetical protein